MTVDQILNNYVKSKTATKSKASNKEGAVIEVTAGLKVCQLNSKNEFEPNCNRKYAIKLGHNPIKNQYRVATFHQILSTRIADEVMGLFCQVLSTNIYVTLLKSQTTWP